MHTQSIAAFAIVLAAGAAWAVVLPVGQDYGEGSLAGRSLCNIYEQIYQGDATVDGHGSETVSIGQLGGLGLGRVYLPGPGLVNAETAATACKAACTLGVNGKTCESITVYQ